MRWSPAVRAALAVAGVVACVAVTAWPSQASRSWPVDTRGDGCSAPTWPQAPAEDDSRRVLVIGDSLVRDSRALLERGLARSGWLPSVRCWGAKGSEWGVEQVQLARAAGQLPGTIVLSLGTNDIWWLGVPMADSIDRMMDAIGDKRTVYWINLYFGPHGYDRLPTHHTANKVLKAKLAEYPNLRIIDFAGGYRDALAHDTRVGWADGVHLNAFGYRVRTRIIVAALGSPVVPEPNPGPGPTPEPTPKP